MSFDIFKTLNTPLEPILTDLNPELRKLDSIRVVVFDIYGTLVVSGTGDISIAQEIDRETELRTILKNNGYPMAGDESLTDSFYSFIKADHAASKASGNPYPEVDILGIWSRFLNDMQKRGAINTQPDQGQLQDLAIRFECAVNPVWPMPGFMDLSDGLKRKKIPMGIVSNAQFYTPLMLQGFAGKSLSELGFQEDLCVWSYEERLGKPSVELFEKLSSALERRGVMPEQALYVGNDMLNDIWTASQVGLRTALFAGDQRSLRLRESDPRCENLNPDVILTELVQLWKVI